MNLHGKTINAHHIGWQIGPRLNAAGRMEDADLAYRLLITRDATRRRPTSPPNSTYSRRVRREEIARITTEAMAEALSPEHDGSRVLILAGEGWASGVIGVVAGRLVDQCRRPVILLSHTTPNAASVMARRAPTGNSISTRRCMAVATCSCASAVTPLPPVSPCMPKTCRCFGRGCTSWRKVLSKTFLLRLFDRNRRRDRPRRRAVLQSDRAVSASRALRPGQPRTYLRHLRRGRAYRRGASVRT